MKLRSVALVGVVCVAALGLIGTGAHAVFTTSTTSLENSSDLRTRPPRVAYWRQDDIRSSRAVC
jgi:hypothetical protein